MTPPVIRAWFRPSHDEIYLHFERDKWPELVATENLRLSRQEAQRLASDIDELLSEPPRAPLVADSAIDPVDGARVDRSTRDEASSSSSASSDGRAAALDAAPSTQQS